MTGSPFKAFDKALGFPYEAFTSDYCLDELDRTLNKKFPEKILTLQNFFTWISMAVTVLSIPNEVSPLEALIRDPKDRPILRTVLANDIDILLTGDKDFLESGITQIRIMSPGEFLAL